LQPASNAKGDLRTWPFMLVVIASVLVCSSDLKIRVVFVLCGCGVGLFLFGSAFYWVSAATGTRAVAQQRHEQPSESDLVGR